MSLPLFIAETLEIWEFKESITLVRWASFLSENFFLLSHLFTFSNFALLVIQPIALMTFDALVVYRLWIYKGFAMESSNKLSRTLATILFIKYTFLNNSIVV